MNLTQPLGTDNISLRVTVSPDGSSLTAATTEALRRSGEPYKNNWSFRKC